MRIESAAVLGSGVMGATIAAHLANAGIPVLLLDIVPIERNDAGKTSDPGFADRKARNRIAAEGYERLKKLKPAPFFHPSYASLIEIGNFEDDIARICGCNWIIEAVVENMEIKKKLLAAMVAPHMREEAILSTNTSGLSVNEMAIALPEGIRKNFLATHFFNPPRIMRLVEIVPARETDPNVVAFMSAFIESRLGKGIVHAKDTPNFIANRIGTYAMFNAIKHMVDMGLTVEDVDDVSGPATARPGSALFGLLDLVGIDTCVHVGNNSYEALAGEDEREIYRVPGFILDMVKRGLLGNKSKQGFYKKSKDGASRLYYDYLAGEYAESRRPAFPSAKAAKSIGDPAKRIDAVVNGRDKGAEFAWRNLRDTLIYAFNRIPEIADNVLDVDNAMKWGYNWELGPFEMLDAIGVRSFVRKAKADGVRIPEDLASVKGFYAIRGKKNGFLDLRLGRYKEIPGKADRIAIPVLKRNGGFVEGNAGASVIDLGDGVFCVEFHTKMNAIDDDILSVIHMAIRRAEEEGIGMVIANDGRAFSAGANLALLKELATNAEYGKIEQLCQRFQKALMALKYSKVPVIAAPHGFALGGGCEVCLHADALVPYAETNMGLVEVGVGLLPGGGGTKEMAVRAISLAKETGTDVTPFILRNFMNIAMAKVSGSAAELYDMGFMRREDALTMNIDNRISDAKLKVMALAANYRPSRPLTGLQAPGRSVSAAIKAQLWNMRTGGFISEYDEFLGQTIARVITGGDVPAGTVVTEEYLLDIEREAFVSLCGEKKTLERVEHMLRTGKALRN